MAGKYYPISAEEMTDFLVPQGFQLYPYGRLTYKDNAVQEMVFGRALHSDGNQVVLRVYTGILHRDGCSRKCGGDAIRVQGFYKFDDRVLPVGGDRRVHRVEGWRSNLQDRLDRWKDLLGPSCPKCGRPMVERRPKKNQTWNPFFGCVAWSSSGGCNGSVSVAEWESHSMAAF